MKLIIDADVDIHASASSAEVDFHWGDDIYSLVSDLSDAKRNIIRRVKQYKKLTGVDDVVLAISNGNFRKDWNPYYKANRTGRKPLGYRDLKQWVHDEFETISIEGLEADDVMGLYSTEYPNEYTVVTIDKDLYTIPGRIMRYSPIAVDKAVVEVISKQQADEFFLMQCITGDATDGFEGIGVKGWGPVTIKKWLDKNGGLSWETVVKLYEHHGKTEADALFTARMARILHKGLYNFETGVVTPWEPHHAKFGEDSL